MNSNADKKLGRRKAGSYGRPGSKVAKRSASKGVRKEAKMRVVSKEEFLRYV